jgi:hypothetical protein
MSGSAMTTLGFPSYFGNLASMSPNVRDTESLPGNTLWGPSITYYYPLDPGVFPGITDEF